MKGGLSPVVMNGCDGHLPFCSSLQRSDVPMYRSSLSLKSKEVVKDKKSNEVDDNIRKDLFGLPKWLFFPVFAGVSGFFSPTLTGFALVALQQIEPSLQFLGARTLSNTSSQAFQAVEGCCFVPFSMNMRKGDKSRKIRNSYSCFL
jgi:hypothetical protein